MNSAASAGASSSTTSMAVTESLRLGASRLSRLGARTDVGCSRNGGTSVRPDGCGLRFDVNEGRGFKLSPICVTASAALSGSERIVYIKNRFSRLDGFNGFTGSSTAGRRDTWPGFRLGAPETSMRLPSHLRRSTRPARCERSVSATALRARRSLRAASLTWREKLGIRQARVRRLFVRGDAGLGLPAGRGPDRPGAARPSGRAAAVKRVTGGAADERRRNSRFRQ